MRCRLAQVLLYCLFAIFFLIGSAPSPLPEFTPLEPATKNWPTIERQETPQPRWSPQSGCNQQPADHKKAPWPMILLVGAFFLLHATGYARVPADGEIRRLRDP